MSCLAVCREFLASIPGNKASKFSAWCPESAADKYPHIEYKSPADATGTVEKSQFHTIPLEQIFGAPHSQAQYALHHPVTEDAVLQRRDVLPEEVGTSPVLQFSVYYDIQRAGLRIHLLRAAKIVPLSSRPHKENNLYVLVYLYPNKEEIHESRPVPSSTNPWFNQVFEISGLTVEESHRQTLVFRIYEGSKCSKRNFSGSVVLPLGEADLFGMITTMKVDKTGENLPGNARGDLLLSLMYNPTNKLLQGTVRKVTNLQKQDVVGLADPYVKLYLVHGGVRQAKWKTSVKKNTLTPVFNEPFQFDVSRVDINSVRVEAVVMDYDRFSRNDQVGSVLIGEGVSSGSGRSHWAEVLSSPHVTTSHWHSVVPDFS